MRAFLLPPLLLLTSLCLRPALATDLSVNFTATIKETTCAMTIAPIDGATLSGDSASNNYYLDLPTMGVSDVANKTALTEASFKLLPLNCNNYVSLMSMTISGRHSGYTDSLLINDSGVANGASYIGVGFRRRSVEDETQRFKIDGSTRINWTREEMASGFDVTTMIRQTTASVGMTPGVIQAKATFVFTYN
ncbi:fimbrial protein [Escherichia fergusonii]|uniref:fimbrial protein n=1 Tax=Escherichia fergusonii TaxID=564 RepID=UPI001CBB8491|nr:fimbrial protein [Escherichia fergusonii]UAT34487.1 fimbrial protein [Escherichia fergusonii]UAT40741.1 fimbrial protein [Escherichia fergusonii]HCO8216376.1 fimbrial protein [Escherichia fergusonii]